MYWTLFCGSNFFNLSISLFYLFNIHNFSLYMLAIFFFLLHFVEESGTLLYKYAPYFLWNCVQSVPAERIGNEILSLKSM